jgi:branched-subunit amino acid aminotransferase/4-amino-4-deoxychorismate lyase
MADFSLLETMRLDDGRIVRQDEHLARMAAAAGTHGFAWSEPRVIQALTDAVSRQPAGRWRVRLLLADDGTPAVECLPFPPASERPWRVAFAVDPVNDDPLLRVKTTRRAIYDTARHARPDADDVILWTRDEAITESTIANVVVDIDGALCTPPATLPLLPGVFREELLRAGRLQERAIFKAEALAARRVWLVNSLREWIDVELTT